TSQKVPPLTAAGGADITSQNLGVLILCLRALLGGGVVFFLFCADRFCPFLRGLFLGSLRRFVTHVVKSKVQRNRCQFRNGNRNKLFVGVGRESFRPGKPHPKRFAMGGLLTNRRICEKA